MSEVLDQDRRQEPRSISHLEMSRANTIVGVGSRAIFSRSPYPVTAFTAGRDRLEAQQESKNGPTISTRRYDGEKDTHTNFCVTVTETAGGVVTGFSARLTREYIPEPGEDPVADVYVFDADGTHHGEQQMSTQDLARELGLAVSLACTVVPIASR